MADINNPEHSNNMRHSTHDLATEAGRLRSRPHWNAKAARKTAAFYSDPEVSRFFSDMADYYDRNPSAV